MEITTIDQILEKFENGQQRYETEAHFQEVADALKAGLGVYAVLDKTLKQNTFLRAAGGAMAKTNIDLRAENARLSAELEDVRDALGYYTS